MKKKNAKEPQHTPSHNHKQIKSSIKQIKDIKDTHQSTTSFQENNKQLTKGHDRKILLTEELKPLSSEFQASMKIKLFKQDISQHIDITKLTPKELIIIINRLFSFLKKVLSNEVYVNIKKQLCIEVKRVVNKEKDTDGIKDNESRSSIFNYVKSNDEKMLKLSSDFSHNDSMKDKDKKMKKPMLIINTNNDNEFNITDNSHPCITINNSNNEHEHEHEDINTTNTPSTNNRGNANNNVIPNDNITDNNVNGNGNGNEDETHLKQSLYHLTKTSRVKTPTIMKNLKMYSTNSHSHRFPNTLNQPYNNNNTQSNSKSSSRDIPPHNKNIKANHNHTILNPKTILSSNSKSTKDKDKDKDIVTPIKTNKPKPLNISISKVLLSPKRMNSKAIPLLNGKLFSKLKIESPNKKPIEQTNANSNSNNKREISIEAIDLFSNSKTQRCFKSSVLPSTKKNTKFNSKMINKSTGAFTIINPFSSKSKQIRTQYIDLTRCDDNNSNNNNNTLNPKNEDMMKMIKMSLDDNMKYMFNFSYENFLSKESESLSKQSQSINEAST